MKTKINSKQELINLAKHIKENKSYNVTIQEAKVRDNGFTDRQLEQIAQIIATTVPPLIEAALVPIKQDIAEIKALPTIARELSKNKKKK